MQESKGIEVFLVIIHTAFILFTLGPSTEAAFYFCCFDRENLPRVEINQALT